jgi:hypothetical protein
MVYCTIPVSYSIRNPYSFLDAVNAWFWPIAFNQGTPLMILDASQQVDHY